MNRLTRSTESRRMPGLKKLRNAEPEMYRAQYERRCPHCEEWISSTAASCFNCGRFLDGTRVDELDEAPPRFTIGPLGWTIGIVTLFMCGSLFLYFFVR